MENYLRVNSVRKYGKKAIRTIANEQPNILIDNFLVMILCNGLWTIALEITDSEEYKSFYKSYSEGCYLSFTLYAVPESERLNCKDEGRQPCQ